MEVVREAEEGGDIYIIYTLCIYVHVICIYVYIHTYIYSLFALLYSRNQYNIVKPLSSN